ncbi:MAG: MotA/TolQ/ExbB proton channel family protein [Proteobacteria bacterium]|jgi:biopolymer transport protein ExbB|nr:MotA/TolQ/ExbB proton channel family protein [Pseudomonadota bacterium]
MGFIQTVNEAFKEGGPGMWPILLLSIAAVGVMVDRAVYLMRSTIDKREFLGLMQRLMAQGNVAQAIKVCSGTSRPLTRIVQAGLTRVNRSDAEVQAAMDEAALHEMPLLERRTGYLAMIGNVATLAGLLGTIVGLIHSFGAVGSVDPSQKASLLARGISEAMNCTAFGLLVGIVSLLAFSVLNGKTQAILDDVHEVTAQVMSLISGTRQAPPQA